MRIERAIAAVLLAACSCRQDTAPPRVSAGHLGRAHGEPGRTLVGLIPSEARAGEIFQRQPDGHAGLAVLGTGFERGDTVRWAGKPLETTFSNSRFLTASIPPELLASAGEVEVEVETPSDPSRPRVRTKFRLLPPEKRAAGR